MERDITIKEKLIQEITQGVYILDRQMMKSDQARFVDKIDNSFEESPLNNDDIKNDE